MTHDVTTAQVRRCLRRALREALTSEEHCISPTAWLFHYMTDPAHPYARDLVRAVVGAFCEESTYERVSSLELSTLDAVRALNAALELLK